MELVLMSHKNILPFEAIVDWGIHTRLGVKKAVELNKK